MTTPLQVTLPCPRCHDLIETDIADIMARGERVYCKGCKMEWDLEYVYASVDDMEEDDPLWEEEASMCDKCATEIEKKRKKRRKDGSTA